MLFAFLWPSVVTATKIALEVSQLLVIAQVRFALVRGIMLLFAHVLGKEKLPSGIEWKRIAIYLDCHVIAMQHVSSGNTEAPLKYL